MNHSPIGAIINLIFESLDHMNHLVPIIIHHILPNLVFYKAHFGKTHVIHKQRF